jgi:2-hydroxy-6-oxonona-2,4-dienedioate hydrolase
MRSCTARCARRAELRGAAIVLAALATVASAARAADCTPERLTLERGETRRITLCGGGPASATPPPGITIAHLQPLGRCDIGDTRPGLQLVVTAGANAQSGAWSVTGCTPIHFDVPDRSALGPATLTPRRGGTERLRLTIRAPAGVDLRPACREPLQFPAGDGLSLAPAPGATPRCSAGRLTLDVVRLDERPAPAKIVLPVLLADGSTRTAIAFAAPPPPRWLNDMREADARWVDVDGVRTRYFVAGRGEPMLLVHGGQPSSMDGTAWDWQQNFAALARHFRVYALDRLGQGYTDHPANLDDYQDYYPRVVAHVAGFMRALDIERAHLVGHSQGSWPVTRIALDHPERVASLTLVDGTMVSPSRDAGKAIRFYIHLSEHLHPPDGETLESVRRGMRYFSHTGNNLTEQRIERLLAMTRQPKFAPGREWFARSGMSPAHPSFRRLKQALLDELAAGKLQVPVLVVWGANDPEGSVASGEALYELVRGSSPRAQWRLVENSGHLSFIEHPAAFNEILIDFAGDASH